MKRAAIVLAVVFVLCLSCCVGAAMVLDGPAGACAPPALSSGAPVVVRTAGLQPVGPWRVDPHLHNAAIIVGVGQRLQVPPRGWVIAVATAMQESSLTNLDHGDRDSLGLFQQRPSQGWGSREQILDPVYASTKFYERLLKVSGWERMDLTDAAQAVQRSATPGAYAKHETYAEQIVAQVTGVASITDLPGASLVNCTGAGPVSAGGWTRPVPGKIVSPYGQRGTEKHAGVDLQANRYDVIVAAAAGTVVHVTCDQSTGNCDIDGSPQKKGCGWYVDISHGNGIATRYCHMVRKPDVVDGQAVTAGQPIGVVGTSGRSSGPHLHFEIHKGVVCGPVRCGLDKDNSIDPAVFMRDNGAPLGPQP
ncbi:M23 family metallopeptidase [Dactylosporangium sp. NPDC051485]|uniref:M23 family metallopeptidase n=1 Tax=Dactylosporangium sp. NPDC051485 TaxID=3154846 RepID=UPI0034378E24